MKYQPEKMAKVIISILTSVYCLGALIDFSFRCYGYVLKLMESIDHNILMVDNIGLGTAIFLIFMYCLSMCLGFIGASIMCLLWPIIYGYIAFVYFF